MSNYPKVLEEVKKMSIDDQFKLLQELKCYLNKYMENDQEWDNWDQQIEKDSDEGNLDFLRKEALTAKTNKQLRDL